MKFFLRLGICILVIFAYPFALAWGLFDGLVSKRFLKELRAVPAETASLFTAMFGWLLHRS